MLDLYKNIRKYRIEKEMSQAELAMRTGYTDRSSIAKIEKGEVDLPQSKIILFAKALNIPAGTLIGDVTYDENTFPISSEEKDIIIGYRQADEGRREAVRVLLGVEAHEKSCPGGGRNTSIS